MTFGFEVMRNSGTHADPMKRGYGYRRGDLVAKYSEAQCKDDPSPGCPFYIVVLHGLDDEDAERLMEQEMTGILKKRVTGRRRWALDIDALPKSILRQLETTGRIELNWDLAKPYFTNKRNGLSHG